MLVVLTFLLYWSFISALYTGSISDKKITIQSGVLSLLEKEDQVMVDTGFLIHEEVEALGCSLVIPPFLGPKGQFSSEEVKQTQYCKTKDTCGEGNCAC